MRVFIVENNIDIHETPMEKIIINDGLVIEFDDVEENRWRIRFSPYQALKVTTIDCFDVTTLLVNGGYYRKILGISESDWIAQLIPTLKLKDQNANFMEKAHHFVFPFQDIIVEVVAWGNYKLEKII